MAALDAGALSIVVATITLGPPQAAPLAMKVLESNLGEAMLLISVGHLGSALVLFVFFQAISPFLNRARRFFAGLMLRLRGGPELRQERTSLPFGIISPGRKYFFIGVVGFVFAFGSFLGVAATQALGMRRSRAFAAMMLGCTLSVLFWSLAAYYLSKIVDPVMISLAFIIGAAGLMLRGKILESQMASELRTLGADGLRVLYLITQDLSPLRIAADTQMRLEETYAVLEGLVARGYVVTAGRDIYKATSRGLSSLGALPEWITSTLVDELRGIGHENSGTDSGRQSEATE